MEKTEPTPKYLILDGGSYEFHRYECGHLLIVTPSQNHCWASLIEVHRHPCPQCEGHL